jgi:hypothetical protein
MNVAEQLRTALAGRDETEDEIGDGGMATIYRALALRHRSKVAVSSRNSLRIAYPFRCRGR